MEKESKTEEEDSSNENKPDSVGEEDPGEEEEMEEEEVDVLAAASEVLSVRFFDAAPQTVSNFLLTHLLWSIIIYRRIKTGEESRLKRV